jgi:membrane-associated phospholipid phosphatase
MPVSRSFPSGHAAAAFGFAGGVGEVLPVAAVPMRALAALVSYSRVHTGVHYPADVLAGALIGTTVAQLTTHTLDWLTCRRGTDSVSPGVVRRSANNDWTAPRRVGAVRCVAAFTAAGR